ncbi:MAG: CRISPR-associated protein Cas4 [Aggregatilineales bacterium]
MTLPIDEHAHEVDSHYLTVTDLKNFAHCARFSFYEHCWPDARPRTYKMDAGEEAHVRERERARRRSLSAYGLPAGERSFNVRLSDPVLQLVGELDELVVTPDKRFLPVDYKLSMHVNESFKIQVVAYAMLVEAAFKTTVTEGYVYLIAPRTMHPVTIDAGQRAAVRSMLATIRELIGREAMPAPAKPRSKCKACEFRRFCNDV